MKKYKPTWIDIIAFSTTFSCLTFALVVVAMAHHWPFLTFAEFEVGVVILMALMYFSIK